MRKFINLEFKNNWILHISIFSIFVFTVLIGNLLKIVNPYFYVRTENYLWFITLCFLLMFLLLALFHEFRNEKYGLYLMLSDNHFKQFISKLIFPYTTILIYYTILNSFLNLTEEIEKITVRSSGFLMDSVSLFNNFLIFPSLIFLLIIIFFKYCKKDISFIYKIIFLVLLLNFIYFYIKIEFVLSFEKSTYLYVMSYILFDSLLLSAAYLFFSKIEA